MQLPLFAFTPLHQGTLSLTKEKEIIRPGAHNFFSFYPYSSARKFADERGRIPRKITQKYAHFVRNFAVIFPPADALHLVGVALLLAEIRTHFVHSDFADLAALSFFPDASI